MNIGVEMLRLSVDGFACPSVQEIALAANAKASFPAANYYGIKAQSHARAGRRARQAGPIDLCVSALPARYQFNCPSTVGHPELRERTGANRSAPAARQSPDTVQGTASR
jgi:hypothetical protein